MKVLEVKNLKLYYKTLYGYVKAVDDVSFYLKEGEILGIAGESGCGKSTLASGMILPKPPLFYIDGEILLEGVDISKLSVQEKKKIRFRKLSIIPQYAMDAMSPTKKIKEIISDILKEHGESFENLESRIEERIGMLNLSNSVLNMYPIELSGGMKQRVVMLISTLLNPSVLIADEITSALDVSNQKSVILMLHKMKEKRFMKSVIFITHDLSVLYQIADRIMVMYAGKIAEISKTNDLIENPLHPYTKMLINSLPRSGIRYKEKKLSGIEGYPPNLLEVGPGCRFKSRCPIASEICEKEPPEVLLDDRVVRCWKVKEGEKVGTNFY